MPVQVEGVLFEEEQQFRQPWLWCLMGGILVLLTIVFGIALVQHPEQGREVISSGGLAVAVVAGVSLLL